MTTKVLADKGNKDQKKMEQPNEGLPADLESSRGHTVRCWRIWIDLLLLSAVAIDVTVDVTGIDIRVVNDIVDSVADSAAHLATSTVVNVVVHIVVDNIADSVVDIVVDIVIANIPVHRAIDTGYGAPRPWLIGH